MPSKIQQQTTKQTTLVMSGTEVVNSLATTTTTRLSAENLANSLDLNETRHLVGPHLGPNCSTL